MENLDWIPPHNLLGGKMYLRERKRRQLRYKAYTYLYVNYYFCYRLRLRPLGYIFSLRGYNAAINNINIKIITISRCIKTFRNFHFYI